MKNKPSFYIFGPLYDEEPLYWNVDRGWVRNFNKATPFPETIQFESLPPGTSCLMLISEEGEPLTQLDLVCPLFPSNPSPTQIFQKVY